MCWPARAVFPPWRWQLSLSAPMPGMISPAPPASVCRSFRMKLPPHVRRILRLSLTRGCAAPSCWLNSSWPGRSPPPGLREKWHWVNASSTVCSTQNSAKRPANLSAAPGCAMLAGCWRTRSKAWRILRSGWDSATARTLFVISRRSMVVRLACGARRRAEYHYIAALKLYSTGISPWK